MFKLTPSELDCAKAAIEHHGYSTLLPTPPEWSDVVEHWPVLRRHLCNLDLEQYKPRKPLSVMAAKDEKSVRLIHLLHPEDMVLYTSLTLIVKNDIERVRLPRTKQRVYSYRASRENTRLYESVRDTHQEYLAQLLHKVERQRTRAVAVTDIADFYASVSQARLEGLLVAAAQTARAERAVELLVSTFAARFMGREGHGIPTGPLASRLLAEVLLNEIDKYLRSKGVDFVRWVDDYNIFAPSLASARTALLDLAAWLYDGELTLQAAKTHVMDRVTYIKNLLVDLEDKLPDREAILAELLQADYYEPDDLEGDVEELMDDLLAVQLLEALVDAISGEYPDYRVIGFVVRRLRNMRLDRRVADEVLEVLVENVDRLSPVIAVVAPLIVKLLPRGRMSKRVGKRLLRSMRYAAVDHHALWILTVFAEKGRRAFLDALFDIYRETESDVVKRYAVLAIAGSGGGVPIGRGELGRAPALVRLALLRGRDPRSDVALELEGKLEELVAEAHR